MIVLPHPFQLQARCIILRLMASVIIVHLPVPKINSPGGADTASEEYTELRSVA